MVRPIFVAAHAFRALRRCRIVVPRMALEAGLMLGQGVEAGELLELMAVRAGGDGGDALRAVGATAGLAACRHLAVRALGFHRVAAGARLLSGQPRVRLVAARARLVALGCALLLGAVAVGARRGLGTRVRLMALRALRMASLHEAGFATMALAAGFLAFGLVG